MKKIICLLLSVMLTALILAGCGKTAKRQLYNEKLNKYIDLGEYKGIKVDTKSDEFKKFYNSVISSDVSSNDLYVKKTEGEVANGDTVNIDYTGKKDGVAFEGGTAEGYDLTIGSNSFIEGFETGLIGKKIGDTVDLNLTFPENYNSSELAGKAVVFTVKINYVKTTEERKPEDYYSEIGFKTLKAYTDDVTERAVKNYLLDKVKTASKIKDYPKTDIDTIYDAYKNTVEQNIKNSYGVDFATYLSYANTTEDAFREDAVKNQIKPAMEAQMVAYSILDKEKLGLKAEEVNKKVDETVKSINNSQVTADTVKNYYGEYYFEYLTVSEKAADCLYKNAEIS